MRKKLDGIVNSVGPEQTRIAWLILKELGAGNEKLLSELDDAINEGWKREAAEFAKMNAKVKENTEKMKRNEHPTNFIAEGGIVFYKHEKIKCPHCQGMIVSAMFCPNAVKESGGYGGLVMCVNNDYVQPQTGGTGECDYEAFLPPTFVAGEPQRKDKKPCEGCE